ncbi:hypothetical protein PR202_gb11859 [Eleusine coracana subsp. coracana]|uniref:FRIGIDA-like protein n=1 Tax=Eleusine coracana subsp. coracana TaxID=191504 RepID=A0AAV5EMR8_ELECO|nr:hypothetical protein PR202_gb11859 [Eleusine coracana subsp. coracana]
MLLAWPKGDGKLVEHPVEHLADENRKPGVEGGAIQDAQESNARDGEEARNSYFGQEQHGGNRVVSGASDGRRVEEGGDEAGNETEEYAIEPFPEQDDGEGVIKVSIQAMDDDEAMNASADQEDESSSEEEEGEAKWRPHPRATADSGGGEKALARNIAAACATMDAAALVDALCQSCRSSLPARCAFLPALLGAADPHALVVRAVGGFLARQGSMTYRSWGNCVALLECVPRPTGTVAGPLADTMEQAERLAWEWKEMLVGKSGGSCRDMSRLAGWGLFTFLASYNILLEFEADEIIRLFDNLPPQLKENCIELCKQLGLIEKMTGMVQRFTLYYIVSSWNSNLIHHLIGNGQPFDAMRLASALNLTDKCPPLSLMDDYVKKAKKTAEEILSKENDSAESLTQAVEKNVNALILLWTAVDECDSDSVRRNSVKEEISQLLHKYADKQQKLAGVSAFVSTSHHHQHQQRKEREFQQKTGKKCQRQQHKTRNSSQRKQLQNQQEQGWRWQNSTGRRPNKNQKRKQRRQKWNNPQEEQQQQQFNKRPRFSSYSYSGIRGVPFAERARLTQKLGPYGRSDPCPANIPPLKSV